MYRTAIKRTKVCEIHLRPSQLSSALRAHSGRQIVVRLDGARGSRFGDNLPFIHQVIL
jgi:hypothetical protein